ncbi:MAG: 16S rRNA (guanine(966)-N(2))-methyltransferase RsmD [Steroidobacteraceae bacterium]
MSKSAASPDSHRARGREERRLRIIGGQWRGRKFRFPAVSVRPTPDRVRETLFNWLGQDLEGQATLDLFAGTGVLSLEALSRGASRAVAIDRNPALVHALAASAQTMGIRGLHAQIADARAWIGRDSDRYDVIFLDPPFASDPWSWLLPAAAMRLAAAGLIYAEAGSALAPGPGLEIVRRDRAGHVHYHLLAPRP